ncbi:MaoC family dehydratase N-terminal domain-containing protein [Blastococcus sp. URHD0036]|uniref:FAS1-like dehydratase domain-containing protein n=1 Tax=Blastococcus sp. URHD0036 TaxID=1380356 RepID=UPI00068B4BCC|nr:MaoC family dehydratase N-terminal domain-containing protein [Blastococcus sp. URHD0036]
MSELGLVRPDMAAIVGQPYGVTHSYPVSASDIRRWAIAVYYPEAPPAHYLDPDAEAAGRLVAPLDISVFAWAAARTEPDERAFEVDAKYTAVGAMEQKLGVQPPDLFRALNGGMFVDYTGVRIRPGDVIRSETVIAQYQEKESRLGRMLVTDFATTWTNQAGERIKTSTMSLIRY